MNIYLAGAVLVEHFQRLLEARGPREELEVRLAAVLEELDNFLVLLHGRDDLVRAQRAAAVLVDQFEAAPGCREELAREFRDLLLGPFRIGLALGRALLELVPERDLDALLPAWNVDR